ncbi:MAG TPA: cyclase, partial [Mycobacterium sp.]|nr:cyclase [Mycobacterium sp.]
YGWHMRAGAWSANRDVGAARVSWERACRIADRLPDDDPDQLSMRIAPRTMLCATDNWQIRAFDESRGRFAELQELCSAAGDKVSLATGMSGLVTELLYSGRSREGSRVASEQTALLESIGDPTLTMGLAFVALATWFDAGEIGEIVRWSQTVIDLAEGDPAKGAGFGGIRSPLAVGVAFRGVARWWLGRPGWRQDLHDAVAMARNTDPATLSLIVNWTYCVAIRYGVLRADDSARCAIEEVVQTAQIAGSDIVLSFAGYTLGGVLLQRDAAADHQRGLELMVQAREWARERIPYLVPATEVFATQERARRGDRDAAIPVMRKAVDELHEAGRIGFGVWGAGVLVETLLERGAEGDLAEAHEAIDWLANLGADQDSAMREITLLRLRALLARARGDDVAYRDLVSRYRAMAKSLGFEGHIAWAEAMP